MWQLEKGNKLTKGQMGSGDLSQGITAVCGVILARLTPRQEEQVTATEQQTLSCFIPYAIFLIAPWVSD